MQLEPHAAIVPQKKNVDKISPANISFRDLNLIVREMGVMPFIRDGI